MNTTTNTPDTFTHDPFMGRDLPNVLDRVKAPISLDVNGTVIPNVHAVENYNYTGAVELFDGNGDSVGIVERDTYVELVGPVEVLDAPSEVIAYTTRDGEMLCADHGARYDIGTDDGYVSPVFRGQDLDTVEYCSHYWQAGDRGHSFCGSCGTDVEPKGHPDSGFAGNLFCCDNCDASAVYVDGEGYVYTELDAAPDTYRVEVTGVTITYRTNLDGSTRVNAVRDGAPSRFTSTRAYVAFVDLDPSSGVLLALDLSWEGAHSEAVCYFEDVLIERGDFDSFEDARAYLSESLQLLRVDLDAVTFTRGNGR
jgi:hypothetical protein